MTCDALVEDYLYAEKIYVSYTLYLKYIKIRGLINLLLKVVLYKIQTKNYKFLNKEKLNDQVSN